MLFPTSVFALFFAIVFTLYWGFRNCSPARKAIIFGASFFFYGYWSWKFACMLFASALINHAFACLIARHAKTERGKSRLLALDVTLNLLVLGIFKYTGFIFEKCFIPLAVPLCQAFNQTEALIHFNETVMPFLELIVLPVGISFYTFQALSYVIDVRRGVLRPARTFVDFANYLAFFPQLVAGPIVRAVDLLPQMEDLPKPLGIKLNTTRAAILILCGLFKKIVLANWLASNLADKLFGTPDFYGTIDALLGVYAYALQIYCDFSAYSDIAIGCALLLGFHFPDNFHAPYFSSTLQEFWRRWHISLSSWLRDYLYIPLGGSRCSTFRTSLNFFITFLLGGIWHGANWTFIAWGACHGLYLAIERPFIAARKKRAKELGEAAPTPPAWLSALLRFAGQFWTFHIVCFGWIFFRATSFENAAEVLRAICNPSEPSVFPIGRGLLVIVVAFLTQFLDGSSRVARLCERLERVPAPLLGLAAAAILVLILALGPLGVAPFIYFQF